MAFLSTNELLPIGLIAIVTVVATRVAMPRSTGLVMRRPNLLVPGAMAFTAALLLLNAAPEGGRAFIHDNPFGVGRPGTAAGASPVGWILMPIYALLIAGLVGLAERSDESGTRGSEAFTRGLLGHAPTLLVAKLGLLVAHLLLAQLVAPRSIGLLLYLLPSVLFAPVLGAATRSRGRPLAAIQNGVQRALEEPAPVAGPIVALAGFLFATSIIATRTGASVTEAEALPAVVSILSFHPTALWCTGFDSVSSVFAAVAATFVSTIAILECWLNTVGEASRAESVSSDQVV